MRDYEIRMARAEQIKADANALDDKDVAALCRPWWAIEHNTLRIVAQAVARERYALVEWLWNLYTDWSCYCEIDYHTSCSCKARSMAEDRLREMLGEDWHEECRRRFVIPLEPKPEAPTPCANPRCVLPRHIGPHVSQDTSAPEMRR